MNCHISPDIIVGIAQGMSITVLIIPCSLVLLFITLAKNKPTIVSSVTATAVNLSVKTSDVLNC